MTNIVDAKKLKELFDYNYQTGELIHKHRPANSFKTKNAFGMFTKRFAGKKAGCPGNHGYEQVYVDKKLQLSHRVIWALVYGEWPKDHIDHIDGNITNNKIENLRECSRSQNNRNKHKATGSIKLKGVRFHKSLQKFQSRICVDYKSIHLGYFDTPEEAHAAYCAKAVELFGEYANFGT
jgi:hypothetical protein